jgi:type II secretory ATPase GspE/PulE/Tfp pilus assembly ATPase PilB-like protein
LIVDDDIRRMIHTNTTEEAMAAHAFRSSDQLLASGLRYAAAGITSLSDVLRSAGGGVQQ